MGEIPKEYDVKKTYCQNTTKIYSREYLDYQNGLIYVDSYKKLNGYFIAPKNSAGKFNYILEATIDSIKKLVGIDPTWTTTASNWENGTFNYTEEAVTGELQINDSIEYPNNQGIDLNRNLRERYGILRYFDKIFIKNCI